MRPELPSGTVTFVFTDIEGSTRLLHALGPEAYAEALAEHRRALREAFAAHGGVEVDTQGDAFFVAFPTASGAVAAAEDGRRALEPGPIRVRMGVHTGTPTPAAEGYVGVDVHRGARVAALAHGGQVLVTETTAALVDGVSLTDLGRHRLKDFDGPARLFQVGSETHPPLRTPGTVVLPTPATPFLGRERELYDAVSLALTDAPRVLTVLGPGGIGKTRFAIELSRLLAEAADGGTVFVSLAALRDAALVLPAVAEALGAEDPSPEAIAARVGGRRTHVLLDNVEQLLPEVASDLASLVEHAVELRLLVTSREALGIGAETRFDLPPLSHDEAVTFFVERARRVRPGIEPGEQVGVLCERLDRLPLALELAAARTRLLPVDALLARLSTRLDLPGPRDADPRHATLRTTIDWSHDLLSPEEQDVFARLAIFPGGCTLEAAEEVCGADLDTVGSLLDKSLVRRRADADGADRYWMLQTIHEFARTRLAERPERDALSQRHAAWILELSRSSHLSSESSGRTQDFGRVLRERDGIRSAVGWATEHDPPLAADIVNSLEQYWTTSATPEGLGAVEALLERADALSEAAVARLLRTRGALLIISGDLQGGEESYRSALAAFRRLGDETNAVGLLSRFAVHEGFRGDPERTRGLIEEIRAANASVGNPLVEPQLLSTLARLATREGDLETALELSCRSAELAKALGLTLWRLWELDRRLDLELALGRLEEAEATGVDGLEIARRLDDRRVTVSLLTGLALAALGRSDETRAGTLWGAVLAARDEAGARPPQDEPRTAPLRNCAGVAFGSGVAEGRLLTPEQAAAFALGQAHTEP